MSSLHTALSLMVASVLVVSSGCQPAAVSVLETLPAVTVLTVREEDAALRYSIDAEYPQLHGRMPTDAEQRINTAIADMVLANVAGVRENAQADAAWAAQNPSEAAESAVGPSSYLRAAYEIPYLTAELVSVRMRFETYNAGAAHGMQYTRVVNARLDDGEVIDTEGLFLDGKQGLQWLSQYCAADMKRQYGADYEGLRSFVEWGTAPVVDNFRSVSLEPGELVVSFDPYQVGPYVAGPREVRVPAGEVQALLATALSVDAFSLVLEPNE